MACHGVARQGEDGRPHFVHLVHQVYLVHMQASRRAQTAYHCLQAKLLYCPKFKLESEGMRQSLFAPRLTVLVRGPSGEALRLNC